MFEPGTDDETCVLGRCGARWLTTGWDGGYVTADVAANLTVPGTFERTDLAEYVTQRRDVAGIPPDGPTLLTSVDAVHARCARRRSVTVLATAGLTNPAALPVSETLQAGPDPPTSEPSSAGPGQDDPPRPGTVNLLVGTERALDDGTLAELQATAVEAKTATLLAVAGFTGTTSDAVAVGCNPAGEQTDFAGSGTPLGAATRVCVRDAVCASLAAGDGADRRIPSSVAAADYGVRTTTTADTFRP